MEMLLSQSRDGNFIREIAIPLLRLQYPPCVADNNKVKSFFTLKTHKKPYEHDSIVKIECKPHFRSNGAIKHYKKKVYRVFGPQTSTQDIYEVAIQRVVKAIMEGIYGTIFAYRVTSSGKNTHYAYLSKWLEELVLLLCPLEMDRQDWRSSLERLEKIYETVVAGGNLDEQVSGKKSSKVKEKVNEEVIEILQEATGKSVERVDLSGRQLRMFPKAFGKIHSLIVLNLSKNQLKKPGGIVALLDAAWYDKIPQALC
ncbi:Plant intracellular Ras-group-related LRR protein 1 [Capsicum baccatum]|uniref:Plant intracellular Ras-group-related LRR protein 1 n=1 Tax=Capsicum baccatum TaxID=33114 RepID=A0A2G2WSL5_CAPBA|nr:Plant intracellular Ras-group-related LRR protein 1 [Capsicum baccatum]